MDLKCSNFGKVSSAKLKNEILSLPGRFMFFMETLVNIFCNKLIRFKVKSLYLIRYVGHLINKVNFLV